MSREINLIVIHCSASPNGVSLFQGTACKPGFKTPAEVIDGWHAARGFARNPNWVRKFNPRLPHIGYHFVLYTNGGAETGRHLDEMGAHVLGYNRYSIGVCMIGIGKYTDSQWNALKILTSELKRKFPVARIVGHRDLSPDTDRDGTVERHEWLKTCPEFDVSDWLERDMTPAPGHVFEEVKT